MIIDKNYDNLLLLIMSGDKANQKRIYEFIKEIPSELILKIRKTTKEYNEYINNQTKKRYFLGEIQINNCIYYFDIDINNGNLFIGKSKYYHGKYFIDSELRLSNINNLIDHIGSFSYGYEVIENQDLFLNNHQEYHYQLVNILNKNRLLIVNRNNLFQSKISHIDTEQYGIDNKKYKKLERTKDNAK